MNSITIIPGIPGPGLRSVIQRFPQACQVALGEAANVVKARVIYNVSGPIVKVRTGRLRESVTVSRVNEDTMAIYATAPYADVLEERKGFLKKSSEEIRAEVIKIITARIRNIFGKI